MGNISQNLPFMGNLLRILLQGLHRAKYCRHNLNETLQYCY